MQKSMIIVGAGISGLSTGCYAQMNGYRTVLFESHQVPGGLCAAWTRKGYKFDISMHLLANSKSGPFKKMWDELAVTKNQEFIYHDRLIAGETADALEKKWPGFKSKIEVTDVPTPMTYVRYTGNWKGSVDGWYITPENMMKQEMKRTLPGLENLYMVGHWTAPFTGTVMAAQSGRQLIQILCKKDRRPFVTTAGGA